MEGYCLQEGANTPLLVPIITQYIMKNIELVMFGCTLFCLPSQSPHHHQGIQLLKTKIPLPPRLFLGGRDMPKIVIHNSQKVI